MGKTVSTTKSTKEADARRAKLDEAAAALAPDEVGKIPALAANRVTHLEALAANAEIDAAALLKVPLPDRALEAWELDVLPVAVQAAKDLGVAVGADKVATGVTLSDVDAKILESVRLDQGLLLSAFRRLRFKGQPAKIKELNAIDVGDPGDVVDAHDDSTTLIALADHERERAWVASLPLGEGNAVARLKKHHARLGELAKLAEGSKAAEERRDALRRIWTVINRIERRVREAAAYLFHNAPRRAEYNAFETPSARKQKAAREAAKPKKAAEKKAAKAAKKAAKAAKKAVG